MCRLEKIKHSNPARRVPHTDNGEVHWSPWRINHLLYTGWRHEELGSKKFWQRRRFPSSSHGLYLFIRVPFGLQNTSDTFQRATDATLASLKWLAALVHLGDIILFSMMPEKHITRVKQVLTLLQKAPVMLKLRKCYFFTNKINYLRHVIWPQTIEIALHTNDVIKQLYDPSNVIELHPLLILSNMFGRLIPNFDQMEAQLNHKLQKD